VRHTYGKVQASDHRLDGESRASTDQIAHIGLTGFWAAVGKDYRGELLLVGRAVNGWGEGFLPNQLQSPEIGAAFLEEICNTPDPSWLRGSVMSLITSASCCA
jgi:hypothetical protein